MTRELKYFIFNTDTGWVGVLGSVKGLQRTTLPQSSVQEARQLLGGGINYATWALGLFADITKRLRTYFSGHKVSFADELDLSGATPFQREVWEMTRFIPYGETRSYTWVAREMGKPQALRAVGQALGGNPLPVIVPCHRVLTSDGRLGGYSGGVEMKRYLLWLEASAR